LGSSGTTGRTCGTTWARDPSPAYTARDQIPKLRTPLPVRTCGSSAWTLTCLPFYLRCQRRRSLRSGHSRYVLVQRCPRRRDDQLQQFSLGLVYPGDSHVLSRRSRPEQALHVQLSELERQQPGVPVCGRQVRALLLSNHRLSEAFWIGGDTTWVSALYVRPSAMRAYKPVSVIPPATTGSVPTTTQPPQDKKAPKNIAALAAGVVGGFFGALLIYALVFFLFRRRRRRRNAPQMINSPATSRPYSTPYHPMQQTVSMSRTLDLEPDMPGAAVRNSGRLISPPPPSGMYFPVSSYAATATTTTTDDSYESEVVLEMGAPMHPTKPRRPSAQLLPLPIGHDRTASSSSLSKTPLTGSSSELGTSKSWAVPEPRRQDTIDLLVGQLHHRGPMSTPGSTLPPAYRQ